MSQATKNELPDAGRRTLNNTIYESKGINLKRFFGGILIYPLACALIINLTFLATKSWIAGSGIFTCILLLILLAVSVGLTYGYLKFARARGLIASGLILLLMALPLINITGVIVISPLSFSSAGRRIGSGVTIIETILFYSLWFFTAIGIWTKKDIFYCLNCKMWSDETYSSRLLQGVDDIEKLKKQLEDNDIGILCNLKDSAEEQKNRLQFTIRRCSKCGDAYIFVTATTKRPFRGPLREMKYILKDPSLGSTVAGTIVELEDVIINGKLLSRENFDRLKELCQNTDHAAANN